MATTKINEETQAIEKNIAYFRDSLLEIQCHDYNWEYEKIPHVVGNLLVADLRHILKCAIF